MQSRGPVQHIQSDGRIVSYVVVNPNHYAQTLDGYTLWHTATGDIVYAITDSTGQMAPSGVLAADQRTAEEEAFLGTIPEGLRFKSLPHMLTAGHLLGGSHFPHTATESDSLLVILVQFQDVQFSNTVATFDSLFSQTGYNGTGSFKDYYRDQSGGVFSPGVRVVGPITMPNNKNYYNQTSYLGSTVTDMVILAISQSDQQVDYSHYDNDSNGVVDAVLFFYAGERPSDKTQGLWPHRSTISGAGNHDGRTFSSYAIFDEGMGGMPTIGTACHEFGHCLGLPDLYDVAHDGTDDEQGRTPGLFSLMASGDYNSGGKLPPNLSVLEKNLLGWGAQFDTLQPGDSIGLRAIGTANDRAWYLPIDGDEFYAFEVRSGANHWDAGIGMGEGGLIVYHGKESKLNTTSNSVINCTVGDEGWYVVDAHGDHWVGQASVFGGDNPCSITPLSPAKPMKNDSTLIDSIWITNIRWKNDTVMLFDFNSDKPAAEVYVDRAEMGLTDLMVRGRAISRVGNIATKGVIYATSEAECNMVQGTVVYDTSAAVNDIKVRLTELTHGATYYCRTFVTVGSQTSTSPIKTIKMDKHVGIRGASFNTNFPEGLLVDIEFDSNVDHCLYYGYMQSSGSSYIELWPEWYGEDQQIADVSGTIWLPLLLLEDSIANHVTFGIWVVTTGGDTVGEIFKYDISNMGTVQVTNTFYDIEEKSIVDGVVNIIGRVGFVNQEDNRYWVGVMPRTEFLSTLEYYGGGCRSDDSAECDTVASLVHYYNYSFAHSLITNYNFTEVDSTHTVSLPVLAFGSDSLLLLVELDQYGVAHVVNWKAFVGMQADQTVGEAHLGYEDYETDEYGYHETVFSSDSTLRIDIYPNEFANHYYMLQGTASELETLGITDTATAVAYYLAHQAELQRYDCPWLFKGFWGNPSVVFPMTINHVQIVTGALAGSDYHVYLFPFNANNEAGKVERLVFEVKDKFVDVTPGGNGDTAWWYAENGEVIWAWKYDENGIMDDYHMYLAPLGHLDSLCTAMGVDPVGLLPSLVQAGLTRNYGDNLPWSTALFDVGDTALHLLPDTTYELCLWATDYYGTAYFQRTPFSTHGAPRFNEAGLKELYFERDYHSNGDTVFYCLIQATEATAYYHVIFGEEGVLSVQGITSLADASEYCLSHRSSLEQYTHQTTEISFEAGTDDMGYSNYAHYMEFIDGTPYMRPYYCWRKHNTQPMSRDSVYRIYVIPYTAAGEQGVGRYIRFSPYYGQYDYSDSAVYGYVTESSVSDITENSATLHGNVQAGRRSISVVGFAYLRADAPWGTEASTVVFGPYTGDPFSYRLTGLQPNTTYRYAVAMGHGTDTSVYSSVIYNTFTTASCTVSVSIDTTICYNTYYGSQRYTSSQTLEFAYIAANGCDSVLSVNLTVLPQRIGKDTVVLCYGEEYDGFPRYNSFIQTETIQEEGLCDSTHRVRLEVLAKIETSASDTLHGDTYEWGNQVLTQPGQYTQVFTAANGCDSTVHLTLVAEPEEPQEGIGDVDIDRVRIYVDGRTIVVDGSEGWTVNIYDASGRLLFTKTDGVRYDAPSTGTYFVQVGNHPARKVVMVR